MAEISVANTNLVRKATFDTKDYYVTLWNIIRNSLGYSFSEDDYFQIKRENDMDIEFHWTCDATRDNYTKFRIWVESKLRFLKEVKVKVGNETRKMYAGEIELNLKGVLILDHRDYWSNHAIFKHFPKWRGVNMAQYFYEKVLFKPTIDSYWRRVYDHVFIVQNEIKSFFDLPRW